MTPHVAKQRQGSWRAGHCRRRLLVALLGVCVLYALLVLHYVAVSVTSRSPAGSSADSEADGWSDVLATVHRPLTGLLRGPQSSLQRAKSPEDVHAASVTTLPPGETRRRNLTCVGWRATSGCSAFGPRLPSKDQPCTRLVRNGVSGYCELEDADSGERFRVMRRTCADLKRGAFFRCSLAVGFANFGADMHAALAKTRESSFALPNVGPSVDKPRDGIILVVYPRLLASAYATIRALRDVHHCRLPVEIWFRPDEVKAIPGALGIFQGEGLGDVSLREIDDAGAKGFNAKIHAFYHSSLDRVLFLDADNTPAKDPSYLFQSEEFLSTGAVFWPDFWHPGHTIFKVTRESMLWELLGLPFVDMFEQESGQLLIDRRRHAAQLELVHLFASHQPSYFDRLKLVYGDKDLFRLAWLKQNTSFHMMAAPPAVAGTVVNGSFCGMTMVQHDFRGEVLFLHRNQNKLSGRRHNVKLPGQGQQDGYPDPAIWTHLLSFRNSSDRAQYLIAGYRAAPEFPAEQRCFGRRRLDDSPHFYAQKVADLPFAGLETQLRRFAMEGVALLHGELEARREAARQQH